MGLYSEPFYDLVNSKKHIEFRLNDPKRRAIKVGDEITFYNCDNEKEVVKVIVTGFIYDKSFKDHFFSLVNSELGAKESEVEDWVRWMREVYSEAKESEFGVVGIKIRLVS